MSVLRELTLVSFGAPGAVGVLAAASDKFDLGPILRKIISNYLLVSQKFWEELVPDIVKFEIPISHSQASFITLISLPVFLNFFLRKDEAVPENDSSSFWSYYSVLCILIFAYLFSVQSDILAGSPTALLVAVLFVIDMAVFVLLITLFAKYLSLGFVRLTGNREALSGSISETILLLVSCLLAASVQGIAYVTFLEPLLRRLEVATSKPTFFIAGIAIIASIVVWRNGIKAPAYFLTCAIGFLFVGWVLDGVLPTVNFWLDDAIGDAASADCI